MNVENTLSRSRTNKIIYKYNLIIFIVFLFIFILLQTETRSLRANMFIITCCLISIIIGDFLIMLMLNSEKIEENELKYVNKMLSKNFLTEVMPRNKHENKYSNFIVNLTDIAIFYAIIIAEENRIRVFVKFNHEETERLLEEIEIHDFIKNYSIIG